MKISFELHKFISVLIIIVIITQGCSVYMKPVTVDEVIGKGPVKVYLKDKRSIKLKNLIKDNESFLGRTGNMLKIEYQTIPSNDIRYVRLKNRAVSTILTFALFGGIAAVPVIAVISIHETSRNGWVINGGFN